MSRVSVDLPPELHAFVESSVQRGNFADAGEYIVALVNAARQTRSDIDGALLEGLASGPAEEWTAEDWSAMKERVISRHSHPKE